MIKYLLVGKIQSPCKNSVPRHEPNNILFIEMKIHLHRYHIIICIFQFLLAKNKEKIKQNIPISKISIIMA